MIRFLSILFFLMLSCFCYSQTSRVFDELTVKSEILNSEQKYAVYLPPDYKQSQRSYPVLYLLHGLGDDQTGWVQFGEVKYFADKAINEGSATPMIIVMPNGNNDVIGYFNTIDNEWRYEDFFFEEFIPQIEEKYRIKSEKRFRAIAGLSMGGGGSFTYALHHPELFSSACPLSAYLGPKEMNGLNMLHHPKTDASQQEIDNYLANYNVLQLIENTPKEKIASVRWYIDCGDDDFLSIDNSNVHIALLEKEVPHEFRMRNGHHSWTYWREALPTVLSFVSDSFHQY